MVSLRPAVLAVLLPLLLWAAPSARAAGPDAWFSPGPSAPPPADVVVWSSAPSLATTPGGSLTAPANGPDAWFRPSTGAPATAEGSSPSASPAPSAGGWPSTSPSSASPSPGAGSAPAGSAAGAAFLALVNQLRLAHGEAPLADNPLLDRLAQQKADDIAAYGYFSHYSPRLGWPIDQEQRAGFLAVGMGAENLAEAATVGRAFLDLENSPLHLQNLLNPAFTQTGVGVAPVTGGVVVDELFAGPSL